MSSRIGLLAGTVAASAAATGVMAWPLSEEGIQSLDVVVLAIFFVLTTWILFWFGVSTVGFWKMWRQPASRSRADEEAEAELPRAAVLMPIYNEQPAVVFARVQAMMDSLKRTGHADEFDFFVLSDSTDPDIWLEEERAWLRLKRSVARPSSVYYRRRVANTERKAGNIADFCRRWGAAYRYIVVLDADSLMDGHVFVELVRRMEADPQLGILQTPPLPLGDESLLSRYQQYAAKLCGPMIAVGLDWFAGDGGNYWGHNAILRTAAFARHCGLSALPGKAPLGGEILSHDFVEAALMRRAGFKVRMATDLTQSYEQTPTTLPEFARRDQRWCQGNLQHARLVVSQQMPLLSRFHLASGVMAYAASPMWLAFLVLGPAAVLLDQSRQLDAWLTDVSDGSMLALWAFVVVMLLLTAPFFEGLLLVLKKPREAGRFGGVGRLVLSTLSVIAISVLIAPIMMAFHTLFVVRTLQGRCVRWDAQDRDGGGITLRQAWQVHWWQTAAGLVAALFAWLLIPQALPWLLPVVTGLVLAVPLSVLLSSSSLGGWFKQWGLLRVPEERRLPAVVGRFRRLLSQAERQSRPERGKLFGQLLRDPIWLRFHLAAIAEMDSERPAAAEAVERVANRLASENGAQYASAEEKRAVLCDPDALRRLHELLWVERASQPVMR